MNLMLKIDYKRPKASIKNNLKIIPHQWIKQILLKKVQFEQKTWNKNCFPTQNELLIEAKTQDFESKEFKQQKKKK